MLGSSRCFFKFLFQLTVSYEVPAILAPVASVSIYVQIIFHSPCNAKHIKAAFSLIPKKKKFSLTFFVALLITSCSIMIGPFIIKRDYQSNRRWFSHPTRSNKLMVHHRHLTIAKTIHLFDKIE